MRKNIVRMVYGSHLYGLSTPESDKDFKGIFMPSKEEILLGKIPKSIRTSTGDPNEKNTAGDVDDEMYSLHYFIELACRGETVSLDMLHAPASAILEDSPVWQDLQRCRSQFYTKNLRALVGYARKQAAKYGIKVSRLAAAKYMLQILEIYQDDTIADMWWNCQTLDTRRIKFNEYTEFISPDFKNGRLSILNVCGKRFTSGARCSQYIGTLQKFVENYGARALAAERNEGIDWKALSHALRAGFEVRHILANGGFEFPLPETDYLYKVKRGELVYQEVGTRLDELLEEVDELAAASDLPEKVDYKWWQNFLLNAVEKHVK